MPWWGSRSRKLLKRGLVGRVKEITPSFGHTMEPFGHRLPPPPDALSDLEIAPLFLRSDACQATEADGVCADRFIGPGPKHSPKRFFALVPDLLQR